MSPRPPLRVTVDPALARLAYRCHPGGCPPGRNCCIGLPVTVSRGERRAIDAVLPAVGRVLPSLRRGRGYADVFTDAAGELEIEPRDERGTCPFLFRRRGRALCALHHVALRSGRAVAAVKPRACRHWPLVVEARGHGLRIGVHPDARRIGCVAPLAELPDRPSLRAAFAAEIAELRRLLAG